MRALLAFAHAIDGFSSRIGRSVAWVIVIAAIISAGNAFVRKAFDISSNSWLELQWWLFAIVFLLAAPWTLAQNEHIRIDVVNNFFSRGLKNAVEIVGHVFFLLPSAAMLLYTSWHFFLVSYAQNEQSVNAGGLPQWPIKALIPLAFALLFLQGLSELIKRVAIIRGDLDDAESGAAFHQIAATAAGAGDPGRSDAASKRGEPGPGARRPTIDKP